MMVIHRLAAGVVVALIMGAAGAQVPDVPHDEVASKLRAAVLEYDAGGFWGGVAVTRDGKIVLAMGMGDADDRGRPIDAESLFDVGSVTKQFTAAAVLRLEMDGKLSTGDTVAKFFPGAGGRADRVTLHHLLTHTSGMSDRAAIQPLAFPDRDEAVRLAMAAPEQHAPGEAFEYCNAGYIVLAAAVEVASGRTYEEYLRETLFLAAGMTSTGFLDGEGLDPARQVVRETAMLGGGRRRVGLFSEPGGEPWAWGLKGAGGVLTTVGDLVKWDRALAGEAVLSAAAKEKLHRVEQGGYAYGWRVEPLAGGGTRYVHGGGTRGFRCVYARYVDEGVVIAAWTHENGNPMALEQMLAEVVMPGVIHVPMRGTLHTRGLTFGRERTAVARDVAVSVEFEGEGAERRAVLRVTREGKPLGAVTMPASAAAKLAGDLESVGPRGVPEGGTIAMVAMRPYTPGEDGTFEVGPDLMWVLMPGYDAPLPGGGTTGPDRIAVAAADRPRGFMPLILWVPGDVAARLIRELRAGQ